MSSADERHWSCEWFCLLQMKPLGGFGMDVGFLFSVGNT
jgi:hypothetical protein